MASTFVCPLERRKGTRKDNIYKPFKLIEKYDKKRTKEMYDSMPGVSLGRRGGAWQVTLLSYRHIPGLQCFGSADNKEFNSFYLITNFNFYENEN